MQLLGLTRIDSGSPRQYKICERPQQTEELKEVSAAKAPIAADRGFPTKFSVGSLKRRGEAAMAAVLSIAELRDASRLAFFQGLTRSAFV